MDDDVVGWLRQVPGKPGLDPGDAARLVGELGLPEEYAVFLREHDGAEGFIGESYARLYGEADFAEEAGSPPLDHLEDLTVFGGNGGGEAYAFDRDGGVVVIPWIGGVEDAIPQGRFEEFLHRLHEDRVFDRD